MLAGSNTATKFIFRQVFQKLHGGSLFECEFLKSMIQQAFGDFASDRSMVVEISNFAVRHYTE